MRLKFDCIQFSIGHTPMQKQKVGNISSLRWNVRFRCRWNQNLNDSLQYFQFTSLYMYNCTSMTHLSSRRINAGSVKRTVHDPLPFSTTSSTNCSKIIMARNSHNHEFEQWETARLIADLLWAILLMLLGL